MKKVLLLTITILLLFLTACSTLEPSKYDIKIVKESLSPSVIILDNIPVVKQPTPYSCGISTFTNISNYLRKEEKDIKYYVEELSLSLDHGVNPEDILKWISLELIDYSAVYYAKLSNVKLIRYIHESLKEGFPVIVVFGSPNIYNIPFYDFHFSTIYGIDLISESITISNAYGFIETISLLDFQKRMLFYDLTRYPEEHQQVIKEKAISKNSLIIIQKRN